MEYVLQTHDDCIKNIGLFKEDDGYLGYGSGMSFIEFHNGDVLFYWMHKNLVHRLDGPARIWKDSVEWWFLNERMLVNNQEEFEKLIAGVI